MRHRKAGRILGRNAPHRRALFRNLTRALFEHGRIITTVEKAKEVRPFVERLITIAKRGLQNPEKALHARRLALQRLHDKDTIKKLFTEIAPRFLTRDGGYTRVIKRHERRLGDAGHTAFLELLKEGEVKVRLKSGRSADAAASPAPAPVPAPAPAAAPEPAPTPPPASTEP